MAYTGYTEPANGIIVAGEPLTQELKVETATNMYPGRLVRKGTNDDDIAVCTPMYAPIGVLGYEYTAEPYKPTNIATAQDASDIVAVHAGLFVGQLKVALGFYPAKGDRLIPWEAGTVAPIDDEGYIRIPFSKSTSEADTGIDLPSGMYVEDIKIDVVTNASGATIDVGLLSTESSGDADGFCEGVSCASAAIVRAGPTVTTGSSEVYLSACTRGALLVSTFTAGTDTATDVGTFVPNYHVCDGTTESVTYTTSSHTVAGNILLKVSGPGVHVIGVAEETVDATSASDDIIARVVM